MRRFGRLSIPPHAHPLVRRLWMEMNRNRITVKDVAERAGIGQKTMNEWRKRRNPSVANLVACFNVLGLDLVVKERADP